MKYFALLTAFALGKEDSEQPQTDRKDTMKIGEVASEINFDNLFLKGLCPDLTSPAMTEIDYPRLTGDWFLQRTDEPSVPEMLPACHHCNLSVTPEGTFTGSEEVRVEGKTFIAEDITGLFSKQVMEANLFGQKLRVQMQVLDTDYDNYLIGYQCFDNMEFVLEEDLEPVHIITVGIAARDRNVDSASLDKWE